MEKLEIVSGPAARLPLANVDTDIIYPARFLLITDRGGLGKLAFHDKHGTPDYDAALAALEAGAPILLAGENFGCGSSREHAVWTLKEAGVRVVIAPSFGEIFLSNCAKNGVLAIRLAPADIASLADAPTLTVDLRALTATRPDGVVIAFEVPPATREALLNGWDDIARIRALHGRDIMDFEARRRAAEPWLFTAGDQA